MEYVEALNAALKYGMAPNAPAFAEECLKGGNQNAHNTADGVLADHLADHGDPREHIVRQDLQHRTTGDLRKSMNDRLNELTGKVANKISKPHEVILDDGTELYVAPHTGQNGTVYWMSWGLSVQPPVYYGGVFHEDEAHRIFEGLGLTPEGKKGSAEE